MSDKPTNPKDAIATDKLPMHLVPSFAKMYQAIAHYLGNVKYGAYNYRGAGVRFSVYKAALDRHMDAWWEGQDDDPADGTPHLANALCCLNIIIDSLHMGNATDDRPPSNHEEYSRVRAKLEALMPKIREQYKDKAPKHWTIKDKIHREQQTGNNVLPEHPSTFVKNYPRREDDEPLPAGDSRRMVFCATEGLVGGVQVARPDPSPKRYSAPIIPAPKGLD